MNWAAHGNCVWQHHHDGDYLIAECQDDKTARMVAACPQLLDAASEMAEHLQCEREIIFESITVDRRVETASAEDMEPVIEMGEVIKRVREIINKAKGD